MLMPDLKPTVECAEGQEVVITAEYIFATDADSDDSGLTYMIARQPYYGVVLRNGNIVDRFIQEDIKAGIITYKHTGTKAESFSLDYIELSSYILTFSRLSNETRSFPPLDLFVTLS